MYKNFIPEIFQESCKRLKICRIYKRFMCLKYSYNILWNILNDLNTRTKFDINAMYRMNCIS